MYRWWVSFRGAFRERFGRAEVVVYTAVTGNYDTLPAPGMKVANWSYVCFTDGVSAAGPGWEVRVLPRDDLDSIRRARLPKILAHQFLSEYDISIWIDANIGIVGDLAAFCKMGLALTDMTVFRHGSRRSSVADEIEACSRAGRAPHEVMSQQYEDYRSRGFLDDAGIIPETGVILRRHHQSRIRAAMEQWWEELAGHSTRDQISLPYVIWRNALVVRLLDWDLRESPWFSYSHHVNADQHSKPATTVVESGH